VSDVNDDTFAMFLAVLTDGLDDHGASGDDLAARVHLSRYHLDRVIAAVAGEPPATLRRRVLLERAAHRLATTSDALVDVAIDAGYSSQEAFTRAFARAYGETPGAWRRRPTTTRLATPNDIHFYPPGWLGLPARREAGSMDLIESMVEHHVWTVGRMVDLAGTVSPEHLDAPIEISVEDVDDDPTMRSLLSRLVGQMGMWNASMDGHPYDFDVERNESLASMRDRLETEGTSFKRRVAELVRGDRLDASFVDATCDPPRTFTYGGMIAHVLTFAAHRRTLVAGALVDAGIEDLMAADPLTWVGAAIADG